METAVHRTICCPMFSLFLPLRASHNGLVAGSIPARRTNFSQLLQRLSDFERP
jgi:hypothetical protein